MQAVFDGTVAPLPLPGHESRQIVDQIIVDTVDDFFAAYPNIIAPEERREVMEDAGLVLSVDTDFISGSDRYGVQAIQFESPEGARNYYEVHLQRICRDAINLHAIESPVGGVIYTRQVGPDRIPRAVALVGEVEIAITICRCTGADDLEALAGSWLNAIASQVQNGASHPSA